MDFAIFEARKYGIRLILSLVNNFNDFGGKKQYVAWARSRGQNLTSDDDFFTNAVVKGFYKDHIKVSHILLFVNSNSLLRIVLFARVVVLIDGGEKTASLFKHL